MRSVFSIVLAALFVGLFVLWYAWDHQEYSLKIAAGQSSGKAFQLVKAIQTVTHRHHANIRIEVFETRGSLQNARLLERGAVDLATTRSDLLLGNRAQLVAELYPDLFHLVVRNDSGIRTIADLVGKRIALPPEKSAGYESFWFVAQHYSLRPRDIIVYPGTEATTDWLLINGDVDALFRVRAAGDASIDQLIRKANAQIIPIPQAPALQLKQPTLESGDIPEGSYKGRPSVPQKNIMTIAAKRMLVARKDLPDEAVSKLTSVLFERRRELIDLVPLAGSIGVPDRSAGTFLPVHTGAEAYYDRNQPTFLQENAEAIALLVSVLVVLTSAYLQISARRRKRVLDGYNQELLELAETARAAKSFRTIDECHAQLSRFVDRIVDAAREGQISAQEFNLFNFTYEAVEDAIRDREHQMERAQLNHQTRELAPPMESTSRSARTGTATRRGKSKSRKQPK